MSIRSLLSRKEHAPLLNGMSQYWQSYHTTAECVKKGTKTCKRDARVTYGLWKHEWKKHGVCVANDASFKTSDQAAVAYFSDAVTLGKPIVAHLSRWTDWNSSVRDVENAMLKIKAMHRASFVLHCRRDGILDGIRVSYARDKKCRWTTVPFPKRRVHHQCRVK